ncbi:MAG: RNA polymerase sigma factor [bacterium]
MEKEQELVQSAQEGDLAAFEALIQNHSPALYRFIYRLVGDPVDAEELTQDTWVRGWQALSRFKKQSSFKTWLFKIGMNLAFNLRKRRKPTEELNELVLASTQDEPVAVFQQKRREEVIKAALEKLPPDQRTALVLAVYEELSYKEIAEVMGRSVRAVDALLVRARNNLRQILTPARQKGII